LFINSGSGAGLGTKLVSQEVNNIKFRYGIYNFRFPFKIKMI